MVSRFKKFLSYFLTFFYLSCVSTTKIQILNKNHSIDRKTKVYIDGKYKGRGIVLHSDIKITSLSTKVTLKKKHCSEISYKFSRFEQLDLGALLAGFILIIPWLWIMSYKPNRTYKFQCQKVKHPA